MQHNCCLTKNLKLVVPLEATAGPQHLILPIRDVKYERLFSIRAIWQVLVLLLPTLHLFQIEIKKDIEKDTLLGLLEEFGSSEYTSTDLLAIVTMGHGDTSGRLCDNTGATVTVQEVIEAFCQNTGSAQKVKIAILRK